MKSALDVHRVLHGDREAAVRRRRRSCGEAVGDVLLHHRHDRFTEPCGISAKFTIKGVATLYGRFPAAIHGAPRDHCGVVEREGVGFDERRCAEIGARA